MAAVGVGLLAVPVIIHLLNRLQYRKVRFAAMEFLLQSQQRNRRRILLEQLLLLLLRMLVVLILAALFARLILDPSQLSLLERPETHHLVILDDSGSMRDRWGETSAYSEGLGMVKRLASDLAGQEGLHLITLLRTSDPNRTLSSFTQRQVDVAMVSELEDKLEAIQRDCGYARTNWTETFAAIRRMLSADSGQQQVVHLISDFRANQWGRASEFQEELNRLVENDTVINLIPSVPARHGNLGVTELTGELQTAAVRVPLQLKTKITNFGETVAENVPVRVLINGEPIPQSISIPAIEPGDTVSESFEVVLATPGEHSIAVQIPADALAADNMRYLTLNVPDRQRVLIVDGTEGFTEGQYVADALSADSSVTGIDVLIVRPEQLRDRELANFTAIYLLNIPDLPADILGILGDYVKGGGGIAWFLGDRANAAFYKRLREQPVASGELASDDDQQSAEAGEQTGGAVPRTRYLFTVPIAASPVTLPAADETTPGADLQLDDHPLFGFLNASDGLLSNYVRIRRYFPLDELQQGGLPEDTRVIGRLRNRAPLFLETQLGEGRIFMALTSVGPMATSRNERWHNWPLDVNGPGFTVFHLELVKYLGARQGRRPRFEVGQPWDIAVNPSVYMPEVRVEPPEGAPFPAVVLNATPPGDTGRPTSAEKTEDETTASGSEQASGGSGVAAARGETPQLQTTYGATNFPGVYRLIRENLGRETETELLAFNVPAEEGALELISPPDLRKQFANIDGLLVQDFGALEGIQRGDPGRELRMLLLTLLLLVLIAEQALAYRLSYHQRSQGSPRRGLAGGTQRPTEKPRAAPAQPELVASGMGGPSR